MGDMKKKKIAESLYLRFWDGDESALEELIALFRQDLTLFLQSFVQDIHVAEELMIDTFAQLAIAKKRFRGQASFKTYLFAIGRNLALSYLKSDRRYYDIPPQAAPEERDLVDQLLLRERDRHLYQCICSLHSAYSEILLLLYFEDMSYSEAAFVLQRNEKQIKNMAYRARLALKKALAKEGFDDEIG